MESALGSTLELNHLALLQHRALTRGHTTLFKLPKPGSTDEWVDVTVAEFAADVERVACALLIDLQAKEIPPRSVIAMLIDGRPYHHFLYSIALSRLGYVPEMIPPRLLDKSIISELMQNAEAKAIVYDSSLVSSIADYTLPAIAIMPMNDIAYDSSSLPRIEDLPCDADVCFIYLTSGSTSAGSPKLVPVTQKFVAAAYKAEVDIFQRNKFDTQDVFLSRGSINSITVLMLYLSCLTMGSCIVYPSGESVTTQDLFTLVDVCGLNRMAMVGTFFFPHIQAAKRDRATLQLLQRMRSISYGGVALPIVEDDWCFQNGVHLVDVYAMTECGILMASVPGKPSRYVRPIPTVSCRFDPVSKTIDESESTELFELIVLPDSPRLPHPQLLAADGTFHSGDLFERMSDGSYVFRGRNDDWIKTKSAYWCDTKSIEEKVRETCGDLVERCIVVGSFRPIPALFIEPHSASTLSDDSLKETILTRMHEFNIRRYRLIFIVDQGVLPRTVPNSRRSLRRAAIERQFSAILDEVYGEL
ncbi:hypothetical protein FB45DRAFT_989159 [Roridomyces roridus]|uniref:AMP-dependent synthetase/ligase domain-containing protein n=1 Tax=Roridomyces roridus TaxID=1738132 RepID=A0AAD7FTH5_9AGAR|nr:hypothetical protein FB45DRAFT_989159 [Roridomyces roridus]